MRAGFLGTGAPCEGDDPRILQDVLRRRVVGRHGVVMRLRSIAVVCALAVSAAAGAQPVDSFQGLAGLIERGADVKVTYDRGEVIEGRVLDISPTSLTLAAAGLLELDAGAVTRVRQRRRDPTRDGALRGLAVAVVPLGALYAEMRRRGAGLVRLRRVQAR